MADPNGKPQDDPPPEDEPEPRQPGRNLVFESEHDGARVRVYADQSGILVDTDQGALVMVDWARWILVNVFSMGMSDDRWRVWSAAAMAIPPGDDS